MSAYAVRRYFEEKKIPYRKCGKLIIATSEEELARLDSLYNRGDALTSENIIEKEREREREKVRERERESLTVCESMIFNQATIKLPL
jgi:L-2-hydroxyglutarate oxidase LhgO